MQEHKEKPILFNSEMVRAVLSGRKTQTRRVIKLPEDIFLDSPTLEIKLLQTSDGLCAKFIDDIHFIPTVWIKCPYGQVGDRLWVRETFYIDNIYYIDVPLTGKAPPEDDCIYYRSEGECCDQISECCCSEVGKIKWRPSIFMPRWASRINLEITDIRVERVQDITEGDIISEGIYTDYTGNEGTCDIFLQWSDLWDSINKKLGYGWDVNPYVWVVEFKQIK